MIVYNATLQTFYSTLMNDEKFFSGFGTRQLGDARNIDAIVSFFSSSETTYKNIVLMEQIHSANVEEHVSQVGKEVDRVEETDGIITKENKTILVATTADCIPIVFADKRSGVIGISHQGWRGTIKKLQQKMVQKMVEAGAEKENIVATIGPSIGSCCYDIDDDRYYSFLEEFDGYSEKIFHVKGGKYYLNLLLLNYLLLTTAGVRRDHIDYFPFCTKCDKKRFFSFRRDKKHEFGEMINFIMKI